MRIASIPRRSLLGLLVLLIGSSLTLGCAGGPRLVFLRGWGPEQVTMKERIGKLAGVVHRDEKKTAEENTADKVAVVASAAKSSKNTDETQNSLRVASAEESLKDSVETSSVKSNTVSRGSIFSVFVRKRPLKQELSEDPFLIQSERVASEKQLHSQENVADAKPLDRALNPFADDRKQSEIENNPKPPEQTNLFAGNFNSQLDRLRAAMRADLMPSESSTIKSPDRSEALLKVEAKMHRARKQMQQGEFAEAYRTAHSAEKLADRANLVFGPDEQHPSDLVHLLREKLGIDGTVAENRSPQESIEQKRKPAAPLFRHPSEFLTLTSPKTLPQKATVLNQWTADPPVRRAADGWSAIANVAASESARQSPSTRQLPVREASDRLEARTARRLWGDADSEMIVESESVPSRFSNRSQRPARVAVPLRVVPAESETEIIPVPSRADNQQADESGSATSAANTSMSLKPDVLRLCDNRTAYAVEQESDQLPQFALHQSSEEVQTPLVLPPALNVSAEPEVSSASDPPHEGSDEPEASAPFLFSSGEDVSAAGFANTVASSDEEESEAKGDFEPMPSPLLMGLGIALAVLVGFGLRRHLPLRTANSTSP